jgi:enoyl-CoA hydratase/carnithine racemase
MPAASFQRHDQFGQIVLNNPPMNLFTDELIIDLHDAVDQSAETDIRAMLLTANGPVFSVGADVSIFARLDESCAAGLITRLLGLIQAIEYLPFPTSRSFMALRRQRTRGRAGVRSDLGGDRCRDRAA